MLKEAGPSRLRSAFAQRILARVCSSDSTDNPRSFLSVSSAATAPFHSFYISRFIMHLSTALAAVALLATAGEAATAVPLTRQPRYIFADGRANIEAYTWELRTMAGEESSTAPHRQETRREEA